MKRAIPGTAGGRDLRPPTGYFDANPAAPRLDATFTGYHARPMRGRPGLSDVSALRPRSLRRSLCFAVTTGILGSAAIASPAVLAQDDEPPPTAPPSTVQSQSGSVVVVATPASPSSPPTTGPPPETTTTAPPQTEPPATDAPPPPPAPQLPVAPEPPSGEPPTAEPPTAEPPTAEPPTAEPPTASPGAPIADPAVDPVAPVGEIPEDPAPADPAAPAGELPGGVLAASEYDRIYANGLPIGIAMATSRLLESGNNYTAQAAGASASGAYQIIDMFWNGYGGYPRALVAPPSVQDQFAYEQFVAILKRNGNNLAAIPVAWYYPAALSNPALMDIVPRPEAGNRLTIREYQHLWLATFFELLGQGAPPFLPQEADPLVPSIAFPVLGPVQFWHDFGAPRGEHGERSHEGLDMIGRAGQPLRAAFDGTVTRIQVDRRGISGVVVTVTRGDGVRANYFHVNDDTPGTTDGSAERGLRIHPGLRLGDSVKAGQVIAYMGDTGNAVGLPHLHFELRTPDGIPIDPYPAVLAAQQREQCAVGIGPWSTDFVSPEEQALFMAAFAAMSVEEQNVIKWVTGATPPPPLHTILVGPDGARWEIDSGGKVRASGEAALIQPGSGECAQIPDRALLYGTGAAGIGRDVLPVDWWKVGVAYAGQVSGDDLEHGDGIVVPAAPNRVPVRLS